MTIQEWEKILYELEELQNNFLELYNIHQFKFNTHRVANEKAKSKLLNDTVKIIRKREVYDLFFEGKDQNEIDYMEATGLFVQSAYYSYSSNLIRKVEHKIKKLNSL